MMTTWQKISPVLCKTLHKAGLLFVLKLREKTA